MIFFADEGDIRIQGKGQQSVVGLSGITMDYFEKCDPVIRGKLSSAKVINDGKLWDNIDIEYGGKKSSPQMTEALIELIHKSIKHHHRSNSESNIVGYFVCNTFAPHLSFIRDEVGRRLDNEIKKKLDYAMPPIVTVGGEKRETPVIDRTTGHRYTVVEMWPKDYKMKQIVGIYAPKKHYSNEKEHRRQA